MEPTKFSMKPAGQSTVAALLSDVARPDPQPIFAELAARGGWETPYEGVALCFSRSLGERILRSPKEFSSEVALRLGNARPLVPLNVDPPRHARYRKALDPLFSPRRIAAREEQIAGRFSALVDSFVDRGECNFTEEVAEVFPSEVFVDLLGLPGTEVAKLLEMRDGILHPAKIDATAATDLTRLREIQDDTASRLYRYFINLLDDRRRTQPDRRPKDQLLQPNCTVPPKGEDVPPPSEGASPPGRKVPPLGGDDIVSYLLGWDADGDPLSDEEILDIAFMLVIAGLDTVSDSLTCIFAYLATHPDRRDRIVSEPALISAAVDELLRWESPVPTTSPRVATRDVILPGGILVKAGTSVLVSLGAANVDTEYADDALEVRFDRKRNAHLAFGAGVHRCAGSHLARRELEIALSEWHRRIPSYRLTPGHDKLEYRAGLRRVDDLRLSWDSQSGTRVAP